MARRVEVVRMHVGKREFYGPLNTILPTYTTRLFILRNPHSTSYHPSFFFPLAPFFPAIQHKDASVDPLQKSVRVSDFYHLELAPSLVRLVISSPTATLNPLLS